MPARTTPTRATIRGKGPLVLVPPSEGKAPGGEGLFGADSGAFSGLAEWRHEAIDALAAAGETDMASTTLGVRGELLERARDSLAALVAGTAPALPAWERYTGVVWAHLEPATLPAAARRRVVVPSALMGLVSGTDPVPDHRGKFTSVVPRLGRLDKWWRPVLTDALARVATGRVVIDLLPREHAAAFDWAELEGSCDVLGVRFVAHGGRRAAGHAAKAAKGAVARAALTDGIDALDGLEWNGWTVRRDGDGFVATAPAG